MTISKRAVQQNEANFHAQVDLPSVLKNVRDGIGCEARRLSKRRSPQFLEIHFIEVAFHVAQHGQHLNLGLGIRIILVAGLKALAQSICL